jgi:hypothetical protein
MKRAMAIGCVLLTSACGANNERPPTSGPANTPRADLAPSAAPSTATPPPSTSASAPIASEAPANVSSDVVPGEIDYPFRGLATIPGDCSEPSTVLTTAPTKVGWDYDWMWTRQALYANPQFQIVDWPGKPNKPMQVRLDMYAIPGGFALVGVCLDGATCNKLSAMYKSTVPTCSPKLHCGALPMSGAPHKSRLVPEGGAWLPTEDSNVVGQCARIGVCLSVKHEKRVGSNPGIECQNSPRTFKVECAKKATCDEVVDCLRAPRP